MEGTRRLTVAKANAMATTKRAPPPAWLCAQPTSDSKPLKNPLRDRFDHCHDD